MSKDSGGHGSERRATGIVSHHSMQHEVNIGPSKAIGAKTRGWDKAVSMKRPGEVAKFYENMAKAKAHLEKHPGFVGWKG